MKAIRNMNRLSTLLEHENTAWQRVIYENTNTLPVFFDKYALLVSNCGYVDLDNDAEYSYSKGCDHTEYCDIESINDLIIYIKGMESYRKYLIDRSFGRFSKSDLFWAVFYRILRYSENLKCNDGSIYPAWHLSSIHEDEGRIVLDMALVDYDSIEMSLNIEANTTLDDALETLVTEINQINTTVDGLSQYSIDHIAAQVPHTYEELQRSIERGMIL